MFATAIRNLAHESCQEIHIHYLDFHMEKFVSTIWISQCDSLGKIFIASNKQNNIFYFLLNLAHYKILFNYLICKI